MPEGAEEGILRGLYLYRPSSHEDPPLRAQLFGSGAIMNCVLEAQEILASRYDVAADVWSVTSYKELYMDATDTERWNRLHPGQESRSSWIERQLDGRSGPFVLASDYVKALPLSVARWFPETPVALGTDGFGRSDSRETLRHFFEVDAGHVVVATLDDLARRGAIDVGVVQQAIRDFGIDPEAPNPTTV
jgi:pyruvate dehydrogenase E1 component